MGTTNDYTTGVYYFPIKSCLAMFYSLYVSSCTVAMLSFSLLSTALIHHLLIYLLQFSFININHNTLNLTMPVCNWNVIPCILHGNKCIYFKVFIFFKFLKRLCWQRWPLSEGSTWNPANAALNYMQWR